MTQYPDQFTPTRVDLFIEEPNLRVVPLDEDAAATLQHIIDGAPQTFVLHTGGMKTSDGHTIIGAYLNCGGERYQATTEKEYGSHTTTEYRDAIKAYLDLSVADEMAIDVLRGMMWYGLQVDPSSTFDNFHLIPAVKCKVCEASITRFGAMEWRVCDNCVAKCEHVYKEMAGYYEGNIAYLPCCERCGRADPKWTPNADPAVDMLNTVAKGGLDVLILEHNDGSTTTITKK